MATKPLYLAVGCECGAPRKPRSEHNANLAGHLLDLGLHFPSGQHGYLGIVLQYEVRHTTMV